MEAFLERSFAEFALELSASESMRQSIDQIVEFATTTLETPFAGVTLIRDGGKRFETLSPSTPEVAEADRWQSELREGPCVDAAVTSRTVTSDNLAIDTRWPVWGPKAVSLGFHSILSAELHAGGQRIGALNLYGGTVREFTEEEAHAAQIFAHHAAAGLHATRDRETLNEAITSRSVIGQAQGILIERFSVDADRAFAILCRYSQTTNTKLIEVAKELIRTSDLPDVGTKIGG